MANGFGFVSVATMTAARTFAAAVPLADGTKVLVTGGASSDGPYSAELYDDGTGTWTPSEMTTARSCHTATLLNSGQVLAVGGDNSIDPSTAEVYSPNTNSWQGVFNSLNSVRIAHTATLLADGRVLVTGGWKASSVYSPLKYSTPGTIPRMVAGLRSIQCTMRAHSTRRLCCQMARCWLREGLRVTGLFCPALSCLIRPRAFGAAQAR